MDTGGTNHEFPVVSIVFSGQSGTLYSQHLDAFIGPNYQQRVINETFNLLEAGQYHLTLNAETVGNYQYGGSGGAGNSSFDIALIPEPSAILLAGLGGLVALTRRVRPAR